MMGKSMLVLKYCDTSMRTTKSPVKIDEIGRSLFVDTQYGLCKAMQHSVEVVRAEIGVHWFGQILFIFQRKASKAI